eukprot:Sspe_Gene.98311::Locus_71747_Transcript_1_1_Confidence_1.000_Length_1299::g.98311::m.98311
MDHSDSPISDHFTDVIQWMEDARRDGGRILVHCRQGISRSATITIAYLMSVLKIPYKLAHDVVRRLRPVINPNLGFVAALEAFQEQIGVDSTVPLESFKPRLEQYQLFSHLTDPDCPVDDSPCRSPKTAPPFASLGFS